MDSNDRTHELGEVPDDQIVQANKRQYAKVTNEQRA